MSQVPPRRIRRVSTGRAVPVREPRRAARNPGVETRLNDYILFETMVTPLLIQVLYIVGTVLLNVGLIVTLFVYVKTTELFWLWLFTVPLSNVIFRIVCEGLILRFKLYDMLKAIHRQQKRE